ncbi:MAG TPA: YdeI/OmpD-associated family protein [Sediminibacterium sp.]|nr:YdeI/OmpD-associated family protein [Sediminibacterium sp.]
MFRFSAVIQKIGINPCVPVPERITQNMVSHRGYIAIRGTINNFPFVQNLVPVKNAPYRLYINGPMLKGAMSSTGRKAVFKIEQDPDPSAREPEMQPAFRKRFTQEKLLTEFYACTPSRQKEILKYYGNLKTDKSREQNLDRLVAMFKKIRG